MKIKKSKNANCKTNDDQHKKESYGIVKWTSEHQKKWHELDNAWITALEDGDFGKAINCLRDMENQKNPLDILGVQDSYLERERKLVNQLQDPLNKDEEFKKLLGNVQLLSEEKIEKLKKLWRLQICLIRRLRVSKLDYKGEDRKVAHYCRVDVLSGILDEGIRLCSLSGANDPTEGKRFLNFITNARNQSETEKSKNNFFKNIDVSGEKMLALQASFSNRVNDLNQFRLYGCDSADGGEGTGVCLVFNMNYFDNQFAPGIVTPESVSRNEEANSFECKYDFPDDDDGPRLPVYWVLYYDSKTDQFYYTPCQRERPFCAGDFPAKEKNISFLRENLLTQNAIRKLMKNIKDIFTELDAEKEGWDLCIYLRHIIKDAAFRVEQEMRILKLCPFGDPDVNPINGNGRLTCRYHPIFIPERDCASHLTEIIAGPKVKSFNDLRVKMQHMQGKHNALKDVKIMQSDLPLA